jgi:hypothetical protein
MAETHHVAASAIERLSMVPPPIWIVSGLPGDLRGEVARGLLDSFKRGAHIDGDQLAAAIVSGRVTPGDDPAAEAERQVELSVRNQCLLARSFAEAGFTPVIEYAVHTREQLEAYRHYLAGGLIRLAVALDDDNHDDAAERVRTELRGLGVWTATSEVAPILEAERDASVS